MCTTEIKEDKDLVKIAMKTFPEVLEITSKEIQLAFGYESDETTS